MEPLKPNKPRHKWQNQWIHKKCKNKHGRRIDFIIPDEQDAEIHKKVKKHLRTRDNIYNTDYIQQYNDYTNMELDIESQLTQIQISNIKSKWKCIECTFINSKHNIFCVMCNTSYHVHSSQSNSSTCTAAGPRDITLFDFMPTIKVSKKYAKNMRKKSMSLDEDAALLQIATQLSLESNYKNKNKNKNKNIQSTKYINNNTIASQIFERIIISMNNGEYGKVSAAATNLFYKYNFLQFLILPKLKIINKNASDNYSKINVEFIIKEIALKRLNLIYNHDHIKKESMKFIYVNYKDFPLLNNMKANVLFNGKNDEYCGFCNDSLVRFCGMNALICGYLKFTKYAYVPNDVVNLIHLFCNLNPEQLLYKMDAKKNISYFKKRKAKIKTTSAINDAVKILHYNRINAVNKVYLCLAFGNKKNNINIVYSDILPILSISKQVKASKYYGSNNYGTWYTKKTGQKYPAYWDREYAALFYQVEYQEFYGHN